MKDPKINFILKNGAVGEVPIIALINFGYKEFDVLKQKSVYKPLRYYTGITIPKSDWNASEKLPDNQKKRADLITLRSTIISVFNALSLEGELTHQKLKEKLDLRIKGKITEVVKKVRIVDFIENEIIDNSDVKLSKSTKIGFGTIKHRFEKMEVALGKQLYSNDVNRQLLELFLTIDTEKICKRSTVFNYSRLFITVMNKISACYKIEIPDDYKTTIYEIKKLRKREKPYLKFDQIQAIIDYEPKTQKMKDTRMLLLILLFTGARYSDLNKIQPENHYNENGLNFYYGRYTSQKQDTDVIIPYLLPLMREIEKYGFPDVMAYHNFKSAVKLLGKKCGFIEERTLPYRDENGKLQYLKRPLYEFFTSHIGRRSFITNFKKFIPESVLYSITGHTPGYTPDPINNNSAKNSAFELYDQTSMIDNAVIFLHHVRRVQKDFKEHFPYLLTA